MLYNFCSIFVDCARQRAPFEAFGLVLCINVLLAELASYDFEVLRCSTPGIKYHS